MHLYMPLSNGLSCDKSGKHPLQAAAVATVVKDQVVAAGTAVHDVAVGEAEAGKQELKKVE